MVYFPRRSRISSCLAVFLGIVAAAVNVAGAAASARSAVSEHRRRELPIGPLLVGYQSWSACNMTETLAAVEAGVNVIMWFATNLARDDVTGKAKISGGPDFTCVARVRAEIEARGLPTVHLISVGGWNTPHPDTFIDGRAWFQTWRAWNEALPLPFDGFDWDLEGNDNMNSSFNEFTPEMLQLVVDMSAAGKAAGYLVTMVPAQSYLDVTSGAFNRSLRNNYVDYHPEFHYHGLNCYAYLLAAAPTGTFDLVIVQLYETWSRADQAVQIGTPPDLYLQRWTSAVLNGWMVNFSDPLLPLQGERMVRPSTQQLVVGLSFRDEIGKPVWFSPEALRTAFESAPSVQRPRGYAFWMIGADFEEGLVLAKGINDFLQIRPSLSTAFGPPSAPMDDFA
eukprot:TRINITY_DN7713_c0_g1_i2.p1 TRINITY_DN7713_c0_g1~~TRINITY_DN7713_c0_g1_i2.p1  ORF type:complete len:404 (+),score=58.56 TRINITY_DN7713_c0_g1_i2:33-1214(+)